MTAPMPERTVEAPERTPAGIVRDILEGVDQLLALIEKNQKGDDKPSA